MNIAHVILVVDDTPANVSILLDFLSNSGFTVLVAKDGKTAIRKAEVALPDLILLDVMMPGMDGFETCKYLKNQPKTCDIPIIFMTALTDTINKIKAFELGAVDYITKPFQHEEVLARVKSQLTLLNLQRQLKQEITERTQALNELQATQQELIQSEKMATLGKLIAGVAHEINTPLGAIRSSVDNIANFLEQHLEGLPTFFQSLSLERQQDFFAILKRALQQEMSFSSKERRKLRRDVVQRLEDYQINKADIIGDMLVDIGIYYDIEPFLNLLQDAKNLDILQHAYLLSSLQRSTKTIMTAADRAAKVVFALKNFGHYDHLGKKIETNISEGIDTVLTLYHNQIKQGVDVIRQYHTTPLIKCYPDDLNQVWMNLIHNALQAMDNKGILTIDIAIEEAYLIVSISDTGKGIAEEIKRKIFDPFFTTKPMGEGSGLGLDIVKKIIQKHQGKIDFISHVEQGTTFKVFLPLNDEMYSASL